MNSTIPEIVGLHVEEAASLIEIRAANLNAPQVRLKDIRRAFDDRIDAHLDGLAIAGDQAWQFCEAALAKPSAGVVFTAAVRSLEEGRSDRLDRLFALVGAIAATETGLTGALGWVPRDRLQGLGADLLNSPEPLRRFVGLSACSMHRVDPGLRSGRWLTDEHPRVRAAALRLAGETGCEAAAESCDIALGDGESECRFWAAWSGVLFGDRGTALRVLVGSDASAGRNRGSAFSIALQAMTLSQAHRLLQQLAQDPADARQLVGGSGVSGDPVYVPWLLKRMGEKNLSRLAAEAFSLITGVDLIAARLNTRTPVEVARPLGGDVDIFASTDRLAPSEGEPIVSSATGPNDDPNDPNVDMDADDGLPWPDAVKVHAWWQANHHRFQNGTRYFMGQPVSKEHCIHVLKTGYQRQRILAAQYLCLLEPGTPLFNTSAPAWRQQRLLAAM
jgi:uncharacterized protein (TIGR02270 family)